MIINPNLDVHIGWLLFLAMQPMFLIAGSRSTLHPPASLLPVGSFGLFRFSYFPCLFVFVSFLWSFPPCLRQCLGIAFATGVITFSVNLPVRLYLSMQHGHSILTLRSESIYLMHLPRWNDFTVRATRNPISLILTIESRHVTRCYWIILRKWDIF